MYKFVRKSEGPIFTVGLYCYLVKIEYAEICFVCHAGGVTNELSDAGLARLAR